MGTTEIQKKVHQDLLKTPTIPLHRNQTITMPRERLQNLVDSFLSRNEQVNDINEVINIENPTKKQQYFFKTMLGWAESNNIEPRNLHVDGTIEDVNGDVHDSPIDHVPVESKEQLIVLADNNGELDKILYSKKGTANGRSIIRDLSPMEGIGISNETQMSKTIQPHLSREKTTR